MIKILNKNNFFKKIYFMIFFLLCPLYTIFATEPPSSPPNSANQINFHLESPLINQCKTLDCLIKLILNDIILPIASVLVVLAILNSGFKFVWAQGNPTEITKAKESLKWVLVGTAVLLGAKGISLLVENTIKQITN